jgi:lysylphosphatidylglycerol synthetase-like protein (DUF2156 family)
MDIFFIAVVCVAILCGVLSIIFEKFWKVFPFAEKHPLVIWSFVMVFFLMIAVITGSSDRG